MVTPQRMQPLTHCVAHLSSPTLEHQAHVTQRNVGCSHDVLTQQPAVSSTRWDGHVWQDLFLDLSRDGYFSFEKMPRHRFK